MNKTELVNYIAENSEGALTKKQAELAIDLKNEAYISALTKGEKVQEVGFYSLEPVGRAGRKGHNPQTGVELEIAPKMGIKFKPGKKLEKSVSELDVNEYIKKK